MQKVIELLKKNNLTISTMESCTGGGVVNALTNVPGASDVLKFSAVTYSNEFKIKMGVDSNILDKYSVYSIETAREMALNITKFTGSDLGVGITGKLNRPDSRNIIGKDNQVFISIYNTNDKSYLDKELLIESDTRENSKEVIIREVETLLIDILSRY